MDTKDTLERTCRHMEDKYEVPDDFKRRIREILRPLFLHQLSADEVLVIEKALERTYVRHAHAVSADTGGSRQTTREARPDSGQSPPVSDGSLEAEVVTTGLPEEPEKGKTRRGGLLLVRIDPKTKTAKLIRMSPAEVKKALQNKAAFAEFLKDSPDDDDSPVH